MAAAVLGSPQQQLADCTEQRLPKGVKKNCDGNSVRSVAFKVVQLDVCQRIARSKQRKEAKEKRRE